MSTSLFTLFAQTLPDPTSGWVQIVQTGGTAGLILGLCYAVMAFATGRWVRGSEVTDRDATIKDLRSELKEQSLFIRSEVVPLVTRYESVLNKVADRQERDEWREQEKRLHS